jgi:hypothetical protein
LLKAREVPVRGEAKQKIIANGGYMVKYGGNLQYFI